MIGTWRLRETLAGSRLKPSFSDLSCPPHHKKLLKYPKRSVQKLTKVTPKRLPDHTQHNPILYLLYLAYLKYTLAYTFLYTSF